MGGVGSLAPPTNEKTFAISSSPTRTVSPILTFKNYGHPSFSFVPFLINGFFGKKNVTNRSKKFPSETNQPPPT
ncbi:hypothetical protein EW15_1275 [Prochlorococcus sp. MIT 0801]|nr:hypothetical protein EW15_1275 [Prochlorococcus sp. MIT 0801]